MSYEAFGVTSLLYYPLPKKALYVCCLGQKTQISGYFEIFQVWNELAAMIFWLKIFKKWVKNDLH